MGIPVAIAILVGLVSSFIQSLGLTIQRKSHVQEESLPTETRRRPIRRPLWIVGFGIYITSNVFSSVFQLDALPIVILAPLGAVSLIFNALLARIILGDHFGTQSIAGTALVALGAILIAVFGVVQEDEHGLDELLQLWKRGPFIAFFSILSVAVAAVLVSAHLVTWHAQRHCAIALGDDSSAIVSPPNYASPHSQPAIPFQTTGKHRRWSSPLVTPDTEPTAKASPAPGVRFAIKVASEPESSLDAQQRTFTLAGLAFGAASGTLAGMTLVLAKAGVELLFITIDHWRTGRGTNEFARAETWFLFFGLIVGAVLQLVYLNYSLTFASPALVCPLAFCFFNLSSIFVSDTSDGLMFYDQIGRLQRYQIALVTVGVAILLIGVWVVSMIQSTGKGGVDVGTWVEEDSQCEDDELEVAEGATLFGGENTAEPTSLEEAPVLARILTGWPGSPTMSSPPGSPLSPTIRRHRSRYGSVVLDHTHHAPPPGFSIGIGAASPGFTLRPASSNNGLAAREHRRSRTQSEGQADVLQSIQGISSSESLQDPEETLRSWAQEQRMEQNRRTSRWRRFFTAGQQQGRIHLEDDNNDGQ